MSGHNLGPNKFYQRGQFYKSTLPYTAAQFEQDLKFAIVVPDELISDPSLFDSGIYFLNLCGERKVVAICYPEDRSRMYGDKEWNQSCIDKFELEAGQGVLFATDPACYIFSVLDKTLDTSALAPLLTSDLGVSMDTLQNQIVTIKKGHNPDILKISIEQGLLDNHTLVKNKTGQDISFQITLIQPYLWSNGTHSKNQDCNNIDTGGPIVLAVNMEAGSETNFLAPVWKYEAHIWEPMNDTDIVGGYPVKTVIPTSRAYVEDDKAYVEPGDVAVLVKLEGTDTNQTVVIPATKCIKVTSRIAIEKTRSF